MHRNDYVRSLDQESSLHLDIYKRFINQYCRRENTSKIAKNVILKFHYEKLSSYDKMSLYLHPVYLKSLEKGCINLAITSVSYSSNEKNIAKSV